MLLNEQFLGSAQASDTGSFDFPLSADLAEGPYQLRASAERLGVSSALSDPRAFTVGPLSPVALEVGCGCGATQAPGSFWLALGGLLLGVSRRRSGAVGAGRAALAERGRPGVHLPPVASPPGHRGATARAGRVGG